MRHLRVEVIGGKYGQSDFDNQRFPSHVSLGEKDPQNSTRCLHSKISQMSGDFDPNMYNNRFLP